MSMLTATNSSASSYLREVQQDLENELKLTRQRAEEQKDETSERIAEIQQKLESEARKTTENLRNHHEQGIIRERENHRAEVERLKKENYDRRGQVRMESLQAKKELAHQTEKAEEGLRYRASKAQEGLSERLQKINQSANERTEAITKTLKESQKAETAELLKKLGETNELLRKTKQEVDSNGRSHGYADLERSFLEQRTQIEDQNRAELEKTRKNANTLVEDSERKYRNWTMESENSQAEMIRDRELDHREAEKELAKRYDTQINRLSERERGSVKSLERELEEQRKDLLKQFDTTYKNQAQNYEKRLDNNRKTNTREIEELKQDLLEAQGMHDPRKVAPYAYEKISQTARKGAEDSLLQREARFQENLRSHQERAKLDLADLQEESAREIHRLNREKTTSEQMAQSKISLMATDSEERVSSTRIAKERELAKSLNTNDRTHSREIEQLRKKYEDLIEAVKNDAADKSLLMREEFDFQNRMTRRAFVNHENELIRDYEKRLDEQREEAKEQVRKMQEDGQKSLRDLENKQREEFDRTKAMNDRRLAQLEQQYQNRERVLVRNYQDELEKLKRTNAQLLQKKS